MNKQHTFKLGDEVKWLSISGQKQGIIQGTYLLSRTKGPWRVPVLNNENIMCFPLLSDLSLASDIVALSRALEDE